MSPVDRVVTACEGREDRVAVLEYDEGVVIVVADGAGGVGRGAEAAEKVVAGIRHAGWCAAPAAWSDRLRLIDGDVRPGQAAAVVTAITGDAIIGASVGDCDAWWFDQSADLQLTREQRRKPLLGGGGTPVAFTLARRDEGLLVVASDGLWKYARWTDVKAAVTLDPEEAVRRLVAAVRLRSGALPDDVAVVAYRIGGTG